MSCFTGKIEDLPRRQVHVRRLQMVERDHLFFSIKHQWRKHPEGAVIWTLQETPATIMANETNFALSRELGMRGLKGRGAMWGQGGRSLRSAWKEPLKGYGGLRFGLQNLLIQSMFRHTQVLRLRHPGVFLYTILRPKRTHGISFGQFGPWRRALSGAFNVMWKRVTMSFECGWYEVVLERQKSS